MLHTQFDKDCSLIVHFGHRAPSRPTLSGPGGRGSVGLTYETMFSTLSTYGLSRTQHSHNIQQAAPSRVGDDSIADGES